jgi:FkbH-like protein
MAVKPYFAPFNQLEQQILDGSSPFYQSKPDFVFIATRLDEMAPQLVNRFLTLSAGDADHELAQVEKRLQDLIEAVRRITSATVFVFNYTLPRYLACGLADTMMKPSQSAVIQTLNGRIARLCDGYTGVHVFDYARLILESGLTSWVDPKLWYLGRIPFGAAAQVKTGARLASYLRAASFPPCKCLVVDLDNTLWGGVVGEEGVGGISLSEDYPGNVYKDFQLLLLSLRDRGVLLAIASKNNQADALEVFQNHSDCVLRIEDFAAQQIHWMDKATSLVAIAEELNIGVDSLAFFDDSPVERAWVRSQLPEVTVIEVPENPLGFADALEDSGAFDFLEISAEDRTRGDMYRTEKDRKQLKGRSLSPEDFLRQLEMKAQIGYVGQETLPRVAQLLAKTNQFNLTNRRHSTSELQAMIDSGAVALWLRLSDCFGDNGLVAVAVAVPGLEYGGEWAIDTFLMSCRVAGRHVETALLSVLTGIVRDLRGESVLGEYVPTPKNGMVSEFYSAHGFELVDENSNLWGWSFTKGAIPIPESVSVSFEGSPNYGR